MEQAIAKAMAEPSEPDELCEADGSDGQFQQTESPNVMDAPAPGE